MFRVGGYFQTFRAAAVFCFVPQQLSMPCRSSFLCRAVAISARGLSVFRAVGLNVFRVAGILIFCSVQQLSVPCSSFLFRAAVFCSVQLFSVPCSCFLFRAVVFCAAAGLYLWATVQPRCRFLAALPHRKRDGSVSKHIKGR